MKAQPIVVGAIVVQDWTDCKTKPCLCARVRLHACVRACVLLHSSVSAFGTTAGPVVGGGLASCGPGCWVGEGAGLAHFP
eukprot:15462737-Alexandrium_andersonii.AAC.1